jgi:hypothetical protein
VGLGGLSEAALSMGSSGVTWIQVGRQHGGSERLSEAALPMGEGVLPARPGVALV